LPVVRYFSGRNSVYWLGNHPLVWQKLVGGRHAGPGAAGWRRGQPPGRAASFHHFILILFRENQSAAHQKYGLPALRRGGSELAGEGRLRAYQGDARPGPAGAWHAHRPPRRGPAAARGKLLDRAEQLTEQIKAVLQEYLEHLRTAPAPLTTSAFLADRFATTYSHLSKVFSRTANLTIEKYLIRMKIERVKELLSYGEMTLVQIADQLRYSSGQHLSNQFRQVTGRSVSEFRRLMQPKRLSLDSLS
jgi:AraC family transcriptional regulator